MNELTPVSLKAVDDALLIEWSDGVTHRLTWRQLRDACPCATCRDEREQRGVGSATAGLTPGAGESAATETQPAPASDLLPVLSPAEAQPLRVRSMKPVGNYAYGLDFTDGHTTGIYTLEHLRQLGETADE